MPQIARVPLTIVQGASMDYVFRWATAKKLYADVSAVLDYAPLIITATAHGIDADAWPVLLTDFVGMEDLNSDCDFQKATINDANTLQFNDINAKQLGTYASGGTVTYFEPVILTGYGARMQIRPTLASETVYDEFTYVDARLPSTGIVVDNSTKRIELFIGADITEDYTWVSGVYELEMFLIADPTKVYPIAQGPVKVIQEVTR